MRSEPLDIGGEPDHVRGVIHGPLSIKRSWPLREESPVEAGARVTFDRITISGVVGLLCMTIASICQLAYEAALPRQDMRLFTAMCTCTGIGALCIFAAAVFMLKLWVFVKRSEASQIVS